MKIIVLGADGYLGWPTSMHLAAQGHHVVCIDNLIKRDILEDLGDLEYIPTQTLVERVLEFRSHYPDAKIEAAIGDVAHHQFMCQLLEQVKPDVIVHYGELPSGPYSMRGFKEAELTLRNNVGGTLALVHAMLEHTPNAHLVKLGTMGEYGTPKTDIPEGWFEFEYKGKKDRRLFPREAGSFYHTTKILDTDVLWFYCRMKGLRVTDLMQGPVYGVLTPEIAKTGLDTHFSYDDIFGTVVNRFCAQALIGHALTVYGKGGQIRGYLNLLDTLQCIELAVDSSDQVKAGELRVMNQFTEEFTVNRLAEIVHDGGKLAGFDVQIETIPNPRKESEDHHYRSENTNLVDLGLEPHLLTPEVVAEMLEHLQAVGGTPKEELVLPRVKW